MANELKIVLKVTDEGTENIISFANALKKIQATISSNLLPLKELSAGVFGIGESVKNLEKTSEKVIDSIAKKTSQALDDTNNKIVENVEKTTETVYTRAATLISGVFLLANEKFLSFLGTATSGTLSLKAVAGLAVSETGAAISAFSVTFLANVKNYIAGVNSIAASAGAVSIKFSLWSANILNSLGPLSFLGDLLRSADGIIGSIASKLTSFVGFGATFILGKALLSEYTLFFRRLVGLGAATITPLERATRLITFFDSGISTANFRVGELIKTVGFLGLSFTSGPFGGIISFIPFVNSFVTNLISVGQRFRLRMFSFLGSSQAQFSLIILDLKDLALKLLPSLIKIAESFASILKRVKKEQLDAIFEKLLGLEPKVKGIGATLLRAFSPLASLLKLPFSLIGNFLGSVKGAAKDVFGLFGKFLGGVKDAAKGALSLPSRISQGVKGLRVGENVEVFSGKKLRAAELAAEIKAKVEEIKAIQALNAPTTKMKQNFVELEIAITKMLDRVEAMLFQILSAIKKVGQEFSVNFKKPIQENQVFLEKWLATMKGAAKEAGNLAAQSAKAVTPKITEKVRDFFPVRSVSATGEVGAGRPGAQGQSKATVGIFNQLLTASKGKEIDIDSLKKKVLELNESTQKFGKKTGLDLGFDPTKIKVDLESVNKVVKEEFGSLKLLVERTAKELGITGSTFGSTLFKQITQSFKEKDPDIAIKLRVIVFTVNDVLRRLADSAQKSGAEINKQIAKGMEGSSALLEKAAIEGGEKIADTLPNSPAKKGPLRGLIQMGQKIPVQIAAGMVIGATALEAAAAAIALKLITRLASGITGGIGSVISAMQGLSQAMTKPLQNIREAAQAFNLSERTGASVQTITALSDVIENFGGNASDVNAVITKISENLNKTFSPEEAQKIASLGINMEEIKKSGDPALAMFLGLSDVIKNTGVGSKEAAIAMELLGTSTNSNVVNVLKQGSGEIGKFILETENLGSGISETFAKNSRELNKTIIELGRVKDFVLNNFLGAILPTVQETFGGIVKFFQDNSVRIRAFAVVGGQAIAALINIVKKFTVVLVNDPKIAFSGLLAIVGSFGQFTIRTFQQVFEIMGTVVFDFFKETGPIVFDLGKNLIVSIMDEVKEQFVLRSQTFLPTVLDFLIKISGAIVKFLGSIPELVKNVFVFIIKANVSFYKTLFSIFEILINDIKIFFTTQIPQIVLSVLSLVVKKIESFPGATKLLKLVGVNLGSLKDEIAEETKKLEKELEKSRETIGGKFKELGSEILNQGADIFKPIEKLALGESVDSDAAEAERKLRERSGNFSLIIAKTVEDGKKSLAQLKESAEKAVGAIGSTENIDKFKASVTTLVADLKKGFGDLGMTKEIDALLKSLSPENFAEVVAKINAELEKIKNKVEEVGETTNKAVNREMALLKQKFSLESQIQLKIVDLQMRLKGGKEEQDRNELLELQAKHTQELAEFTRMQEQQLEIFKKFNQDKAAEEEFVRQQRREKENFEALQSAETEKRKAQQSRDDLLATLNLMGTVVGGVGQLMSEVFEMLGKKSKEFFFAQKAVALAEAIINVAKGVTAALGEGGGGIAQAAVVSALGAVQIAKIISSTIQGKAQGGLITQGTGPTADDTVIRVSRGEFVAKERAVAFYGADFFNALNNLQLPKPGFNPQPVPVPAFTAPRSAFASGGLVMGGQSAEEKKQPLNIAVSVDPHEVAAKGLSGLEGDKVFINAIGRNKRAIQMLLNG